MKILFVVQRYGAEVAGGAEAHCALFAERLTMRGHSVSVLTSRARDYDTWADHYPAGEDVVAGVRVRRLGGAATRDVARFSALSQRIVPAGPPTAAVAEAAWMAEQGPTLLGFAPVLREEAARHDVVVFFTYLYATTVLGLTTLAGQAPTVLHPTAHEEWPLRLPLVRSAIEHAGGLAVSTPEELDLIERRFRPSVPASVIGIGFEPPTVELDVAGFRRRHGLGDRPYVLCLGRIDPNKNTGEAVAFVQEYRRRHDSDVTLVLCGAEMMEIPDRDGVVVTGFVDDATRWSAIAGADVLLQPSVQESFGMTIAEAWLMERPVLVQHANVVTRGLVERSGGGATYAGYSSFDAALDVLLSQPELRQRAGAAGLRHVAAEYSWDAVMGRYEDLLERVRASVGA